MLNFFRKAKPATLPFRTDIHCHIVPGVDDGSPDAATSADLVERMQQWGIQRIFASPHVAESTFENTPDTLDPALDELNDELARRGNSMKVLRHAEYRIDPFSRAQIEEGIASTLPDKYILIENSFVMEPMGLDEYVFDLRLRGFMPVLAHPERYRYYSNGNKQRYEQLHRAGLLFQVNLLSLADHYGSNEKATAEWLISKGFVDFLGTDLHNHNHADSIERYLRTSRATQHFKALEGKLFNDSLSD